RLPARSQRQVRALLAQIGARARRRTRTRGNRNRSVGKAATGRANSRRRAPAAGARPLCAGRGRNSRNPQCARPGHRLSVRTDMNDRFDPFASPSEKPALPTPTRQRWQPLRLGLVELYHYDSEEFWFRDGHLLLRGNNGTGKSKVLSLTLPFLL